MIDATIIAMTMAAMTDAATIAVPITGVIPAQTIAAPITDAITATTIGVSTADMTGGEMIVAMIGEITAATGAPTIGSIIATTGPATIIDTRRRAIERRPTTGRTDIPRTVGVVETDCPSGITDRAMS